MFAGISLAIGPPRFFLGAFFLFTINGVFIALAVQLVRDEWFDTRAHRYLAALEASQKDLVILTRDVLPRQRRIETVARATAGAADARGLVVVLDAPRRVPAADVTRLKRWLGVRLADTAVEVFVRKPAP